MTCVCGKRATEFRRSWTHRGWQWRGKVFYASSWAEGFRCKRCNIILAYPVDGSGYRAEVERMRERLRVEGEIE